MPEDNPPPQASVADRVLALLGDAPYTLMEHPPVRSATHAAVVRGTPLSMGGKAVVMKLDRGIGMAVLALRGDHDIEGRLLRQHLGVRRYRFATRDELAVWTGLEPGSVPPLGRPVFALPLYVEAQLAAAPRVAFTVGEATRSVVMSTEDWLRVASPVDLFSFARVRPG